MKTVMNSKTKNPNYFSDSIEQLRSKISAWFTVGLSEISKQPRSIFEIEPSTPYFILQSLFWQVI